MEAKAMVRRIRIAPQKCRVVMNLIRGKSVVDALNILRFVPKRASREIFKVVQSAAANAEHNFNMNKDALVVAACFVDEGPTWKRIHPRQRGQAFPILKRSSHLTVVVKEKEGGR